MDKKEPVLYSKAALAFVSIRNNIKTSLKQRLGLKFLAKLLNKHPFATTTLVKPEGNATLFEVEALYYDKNLEPVTILKKYGQTGLYSFHNEDLLGFKEYKKIPSDEIEI